MASEGINTTARKQHPNAPSLCCGAPMARPGQAREALLTGPEIKHSWTQFCGFVSWPGKRDGPKCPSGEVKVTFCLDAMTCVVGRECMTPQK